MRVEYVLTFTSVLPPTLDEISRLRAAFKERLPDVTDFSGPGGPFNLSIGSGMGAGFDNLEKGIGLALRDNRMFAAWQRLTPETSYVRFDTLRDYLSEAWDIIERRPIAKAVGVYINLIPHAHGKAIDLVSDTLFARLPNGSISTDARGTWELMGGEFKLNIAPVVEGAVLDTRFSIPVTDNPINGVDDAHAALIDLFASIITEQAKHVWKLEHSR